jgi:hypothetical protein
MKNKKSVPKNPATLNPVDWSYLFNSAPPIIWRHRWDDYARSLGLPYSRGTMQNRDSAQTGPAKVTFGNRVGYTREALVEWLNRTGKEVTDGSQSTDR